jgi:hypothetical protein
MIAEWEGVSIPKKTYGPGYPKDAKSEEIVDEIESGEKARYRV